MRGKKFYTVLDLKSAFHHIDIEPNSVKYTSFVTTSASLKAPFGFKNSPSVFMRYIHLIFRELLDNGKIFIYIDDIMIATESAEQNLEILQTIFKILVENKLTLRVDKCCFLYKKINYLGYSIEGDNIIQYHDLPKRYIVL